MTPETRVGDVAGNIFQALGTGNNGTNGTGEENACDDHGYDSGGGNGGGVAASKTMSARVATFNLASSVVGAGIMALPNAFRVLGVLGGCLGRAGRVETIVCTYGIRIIGRV
jgi:hypothetical protein